MNDEPDVLGPRIGAALLDILVLGVVFVVLGLLLGKGETDDGSASINLEGASALLFFAIVTAYYCLLEAGSGQTLGKRALGIKVVRDDGAAPGFGPALIRTLLRVIDALPAFYFVGFIVVLVTGTRRKRLGDLVAGTRVVKA